MIVSDPPMVGVVRRRCRCNSNQTHQWRHQHAKDDERLAMATEEFSYFRKVIVMPPNLLAATQTTEAPQLFFALLALLCQVFVIGTIILKVASLRGGKGRYLYYRYLFNVRPMARGLAFTVALVTMSGSLYFSEIAHYEPCHFCWIQRYFLYPQVLVCGLFLLKPAFRWLRWLALTLAICDLPVSTYHFLIERYPKLEGRDVCSSTGPTCTFTWFREFGFVTLSFMAFSAAATILTLMLVTRAKLPHDRADS